MNKMNEGKTPNEIPGQKHPHNPSPLKDPVTPSKNNPINPKKDEPDSNPHKNNKRNG